jgi:hypothetical protein
MLQQGHDRKQPQEGHSVTIVPPQSGQVDVQVIAGGRP